MRTKLTLRLDDELIRKAKRVAKDRGKSLSQIVGEFLTVLPDASSENDDAESELPLIVQSLKGALKGHDVSEDAYHEYLEEKYR